MAKILCPNREYSGVSASVAFVNGVGYTDVPHLIQWFQSRGYQVEDEAPDHQKEAPKKRPGAK